jgi:hypothetical protein
MQVTPVAAQRDEDGRANYKIHMTTTYRADQLVFVDEAACNRSTSKRGWAWAPCGEQARRHDVYIRGIKCVNSSLLSDCAPPEGDSLGTLFSQPFP